MLHRQQQEVFSPALSRLLDLGNRLFGEGTLILLLKDSATGAFHLWSGTGPVEILKGEGSHEAQFPPRLQECEIPLPLQQWATGRDLRLGRAVAVGADDQPGLLAVATSASERAAGDWDLLESVAEPVAALLERNRRFATEGEGMPLPGPSSGGLLAVEKELPSVTDQLLEILCRVSRSGRIQSINAAAERLLGHEPGALVGREFSSVVHPDDRARLEEALSDGARTGGFEIEIRCQQIDGDSLHIDCRGALIRERAADGENGFFVAGRNISRRKRAEAEVRRLEKWFQLVWKTSRDAMRLIDGKGLIVEANDAYCQLVEKPREELLGAPFVVAYKYSVDPRQVLQEFEINFAKRAIPSRLDVAVTLWNGASRIFERSSSFFEVENRTLLVTIYRDITDRRRREAELRELNAALQLRAAQLGGLTLQLTQVEQAERRRLAQTVHDHLQQLLVAARMTMERIRRRLPAGEVSETAAEVESLLTESIEASRSITVELSPPILHDGGLIAALEWLGRRMLQKHGLQVSLTAQPEAEPQCESVRLFLFQAVRELLFNCFKHAGVSEVTVLVAVSGPDMVRVVVEDQGAGFDWKSVRSSAGSRDCFGLFSLVERIEYLGGRVEVRTSPGAGTTVALVVPLAPKNEPPGAAAPLPALRVDGGRSGGELPESSPSAVIRLLLVDDHKIMRQGLRELLHEQTDMEVVGEAENGLEGLQLARELRPDVVVMDLAMPVMNGVEATRQVTAELPETLVIGLSMHMREDMATAMLEAGAVAYVTKATASETLTRTIRESLRKNAALEQGR